MMFSKLSEKHLVSFSILHKNLVKIGVKENILKLINL